MQRLLHLGTVVNDQRIYQRANRTWATGLGRAQTVAQTPAQTDAQRRTNHAANPQESCTDLHAHHTHYTTYNEQADAAWPAAAPFDEDDLHWGDGR